MRCHISTEFMYLQSQATLDLNGDTLEASPLKSRTSWPFLLLFNFLVELLANALRQQK